jgi:hypothetical protein
MRTVFFILLSIANCLCIKAQEHTAIPQVRPIVVMPFTQISGGVILIKACINDKTDSLNFILDTGSGGISLDSTTSITLGINSIESDTIISGIGGVQKVRYAFDETLQIGGLTIEHLAIHRYDYSLLSSIYGEKIDGVIGFPFFKRYIVQIDFEHNQLLIYHPGKFHYPHNGTLMLIPTNPIPLKHILVKDKTNADFDFFFDTGAGLPFLMSEQFIKDNAILSSTKNSYLTQAEGLGGKKQMRLTVVKSIKIGPYTFRKVPTYLFKDDYNVTAYPLSGGLIGNEILRRFNLIINYGQHEIHLLPNKHYFDAFEYGYSGLNLFLVNDQILVEDVIQNSPADLAGLKIGDEVISVEGNFSGNLQQYKNMLQEPEKKLKLIIKRSGVLLSINMTTWSIL